MAKPNQTPQGVPVRRGAYNYENRHGALNDVNQDQQVSFADTFLGDLLGFDGQAGAQGAGMMDSIRGARRGVAESLRPQMRPEDAPIDDPMAPESDIAQPGDAVPEEITTTELPPAQQEPQYDKDGNLIPLAGAAAAAAAGAVAAKKLARSGAQVHPRNKGSVALTPDENGNVTVMRETNQGFQRTSVPAQRAVDEGWSVVGVNYEDGSNALPAPNNSGIENVSEGAGAADDATRAIDTNEVVPNNRVSADKLPNGSTVVMASPTRPSDTIIIGADGTPQILHQGGTISPMSDAEFKRITGITIPPYSRDYKYSEDGSLRGRADKLSAEATESAQEIARRAVRALR